MSISQSESQSDSDSRAGSIVVLVVDADAQRRISAIESLSTPLLHVLTTSSRLEALEILSREVIDIVVADVDLQDMSGLDFTAELKLDDGLTKIPTLLIVDQSDLSTIGDGFLAGATGFAFRQSGWVAVGYQIMYLLRASLIAAARATSES